MRIWFKSSLYLVLAIGFSVAVASAYVEFFRAVNRDDTRTVGELLERGFDPNAVGESGQTALYLALRDDSPKVTSLLLKHPGLRFDQANPVGETPLMMAALRGQMSAAQQLLQLGASVQREGWTPLHYAASGPEPKMLALLLDRGAAVDARAPNGSTALMMAAQYGLEDSVQLLLARGANAKLRNAGQLSAADLARMAERDSLALRLDQAAR